MAGFRDVLSYLARVAIVLSAASLAPCFDDKDTPQVLTTRQPTLTSVFPMGITVGQSAEVEIPGEYLDGIVSLVSNCTGVTWAILEASPIVLKVQVQTSSDARPGPCFVRAHGARGQSNRLLFRVTAWPTATEQEPNDFQEDAGKIQVPSIVHGRLSRINDSDFFRLEAVKGQRQVFSLLNARNGLNGHLALTLLDAHGKEIAHNHYGVGPDPSLDHTFEESGTFLLVVTSRRSGDFFSVISDSTLLNWQYQLSVGQSPTPKSLFPLGGKRGTSVAAELRADFLDGTAPPTFTGKGVSARLHPSEDSCKCRFKVTIDIAQDADPGEHFLHFPDPSGNALLLGFVVSDNNELLEKEPNDREETAQEVALPLTINGRIAEPGDRDRFRIKVNPDDDLTFSIVARGVGSKMTDPYVALSRAGGDLVGVGDDGCQQILGKDEECPSYFSSIGRKRKLDPEVSNRFVSKSANDADAAGEYIVQVGDMSMRGGEENNYRLTVRKRTPDFQMGITMAQISASRGAPAKVPVVLLRREGFRGKVEVRATNLPPGWTGRPVILEGDEDSGTLEIVQEQSAVATASIEIVGTAKIGKIELTHVAELVPYLVEDGFGYVEAPVLKVPVSFVAPALYALALEPVKRGATFDLHKPEPVELNVTIKRAAGFQVPITIMGESLPAGISLRASEAATGEKAQVSLIADPRLAKPGIYRVALRGTAEVAGELITDLSQSFRIEVRQ